MHARGGRRHTVEALDLPHRAHGGPALAQAGGLVHCHGWHLRVWLLLVLPAGWQPGDGRQAARYHEYRGGSARRKALLRYPAQPGWAIRAESPELFFLPAGAHYLWVV